MSNQDRFEFSPKDPEGSVNLSSEGVDKRRDNLPKQSDPLNPYGYLSDKDREKVRQHRAQVIGDMIEDLERRALDARIARDIAEGNTGEHLSDYERYKKQLGLE